MKRAPLKRKGRSRFPKRRDPAYLAWMRGKGCLVCGQPGVPHHVTTRGAGGYDAGGCVPLCGSHHAELHDHGRQTFEARWRLSLEGWARFYWDAYCAENATRERLKSGRGGPIVDGSACVASAASGTVGPSSPSA